MSEQAALKQVERGALLSIVTYIAMAILKISVGYFFFSQALIADGFNNVTDILSSVFVLVGIRLAQKPVDANHPYGHRRFETVASLATSFIMFFIGMEVFRDAVQSFFQPDQQAPSLLSAIVGFASSVILFLVYRYNIRLAARFDSIGLKASAKDNLSDALISMSTSIAILFATFGVVWMDTVMALVVAVIILKTAVTIFKESSFELTDGFPPDEMHVFEEVVLAHPEVKGIKELKARRYSSMVYLDVTVFMDPHLTVTQSHDVTEDIERELAARFAIHSIDIHVEPYNSHYFRS